MARKNKTASIAKHTQPVSAARSPSERLTDELLAAYFPKVDGPPPSITHGMEEFLTWLAPLAVFHRDPGWRQLMRKLTIQAMTLEKPLPIVLRQWITFVLLEHDDVPARPKAGRVVEQHQRLKRLDALAEWWAHDIDLHPSSNVTARIQAAADYLARFGWSLATVKRVYEDEMFPHALKAEQRYRTIQAEVILPDSGG